MIDYLAVLLGEKDPQPRGRLLNDSDLTEGEGAGGCRATVDAFVAISIDQQDYYMTWLATHLLLACYAPSGRAMSG